MSSKIDQIALGGGCHWCTEAVFQSLIGVVKVEQGYVSSTGENSSFSEAVIIHYNAAKISLSTLIEIHLHTHNSTSDHSMRFKYRSAIYVFSEKQKLEAKQIIDGFQERFDFKLISEVLPYDQFKPSREQIVNYYYSNPEKPFCKSFINPKLRLLLDKFSEKVDSKRLTLLVKF
jgi:peptide-methionine (S)-S-oxide reductase